MHDIGGRPSLPPSIKKDNRPTVESKLRITQNAPQTIEELLAMPSDLPDIECAPIGQEVVDEYAELPLIESIDVESFGSSLQVEEETDEILQAAKRGRQAMHDRLSIALKDLVIDPRDFEWSNTKTDPPTSTDADVAGCFMFDDLPASIQCL